VFFERERGGLGRRWWKEDILEVGKWRGDALKK
jgi:hypothetical protein